MIFGETGSAYTPIPTPLTEIASQGGVENGRISQLVLTGVVLNALPQNEADAFRELIWASASKYLDDQPEVLSTIAELCNVLAVSAWPEINDLIDRRFESDTKLREVVEAISDDSSDKR